MNAFTVTKPQARLIDCCLDGHLVLVSKTKAEVVNHMEAIEVLQAIEDDHGAPAGERKSARSLLAKIDPWDTSSVEPTSDEAIDEVIREWEFNDEARATVVPHAGGSVIVTHEAIDPIESGKRPFVLIRPGQRTCRFASLEAAIAFTEGDVLETGTDARLVDEMAGVVRVFTRA